MVHVIGGWNGVGPEFFSSRLIWLSGVGGVPKFFYFVTQTDISLARCPVTVSFLQNSLCLRLIRNIVEALWRFENFNIDNCVSWYALK